MSSRHLAIYGLISKIWVITNFVLHGFQLNGIMNAMLIVCNNSLANTLPRLVRIANNKIVTLHMLLNVTLRSMK